jgi:MFS family permease
MLDMSANASGIDIPALIDASKLGRFQIWILVLVGLTVLMDGFDVQAMGYVAPAIIQEWGVSKASLGPVFGAGLFGMLVGSLSLSVLADKSNPVCASTATLAMSSPRPTRAARPLPSCSVTAARR